MASSASATTPRIPRLLLRYEEAAQALSVSDDHFRRHIVPQLRVVRSGRLKRVPIAEVERWVAENAALTLDAA